MKYNYSCEFTLSPSITSFARNVNELLSSIDEESSQRKHDFEAVTETYLKKLT